MNKIINNEKLIDLCADEPEVVEVLRYLREREVVHFQRFGESLRIVQDNLDSKNFYAINPAFDMSDKCNCK